MATLDQLKLYVQRSRATINRALNRLRNSGQLPQVFSGRGRSARGRVPSPASTVPEKITVLNALDTILSNRRTSQKTKIERLRAYILRVNQRSTNVGVLELVANVSEQIHEITRPPAEEEEEDEDEGGGGGAGGDNDSGADGDRGSDEGDDGGGGGGGDEDDEDNTIRLDQPLYSAPSLSDAVPIGSYHQLDTVGEVSQVMFNGGIVAALQYNLDDVLNVFAHVYPATTPLGSVLFTGYITGNGRLFGFGRYYPQSLQDVLDQLDKYNIGPEEAVVVRGYFQDGGGFIRQHPHGPFMPIHQLHLQDTGGIGGSVHLMTHSVDTLYMYNPSFGDCFRKCLRYVGFDCKVLNHPSVKSTREENQFICTQLKLTVMIVSIEGVDVIQSRSHTEQIIYMLAHRIKSSNTHHVCLLKSLDYLEVALIPFIDSVEDISGVLYRSPELLNRFDFSQLEADCSTGSKDIMSNIYRCKKFYLEDKDHGMMIDVYVFDRHGFRQCNRMDSEELLSMMPFSEPDTVHYFQTCEELVMYVNSVPRQLVYACNFKPGVKSDCLTGVMLEKPYNSAWLLDTDMDTSNVQEVNRVLHTHYCETLQTPLCMLEAELKPAYAFKCYDIMTANKMLILIRSACQGGLNMCKYPSKKQLYKNTPDGVLHLDINNMYPTVMAQSTILLDYKSVVIFHSETTLPHANYYKLYLVTKAVSACYTYQVPTMMSEEHIKALHQVNFQLCVSNCGLAISYTRHIPYRWLAVSTYCSEMRGLCGRTLLKQTINKQIGRFARLKQVSLKNPGPLLTMFEDNPNASVQYTDITGATFLPQFMYVMQESKAMFWNLIALNNIQLTDILAITTDSVHLKNSQCYNSYITSSKVCGMFKIVC